MHAALLDQARQRGPVGPGTEAGSFGFDTYRGSQYHSYGRPYRGFHRPYVKNIWDPMTRGFRYPVRRHRYPLGFGRPVSMFSRQFPSVFPGYQSGKVGLRPSVVKDRSEPVRLNLTVDNNNNNVIQQNGSSNVQVNQVVQPSNTPTPSVNENSPVIP